MKMEIIILAAEDYTIKDENGINAGVSVQYIATDNLTPCNDGNFRGYRVIKEWLPISLNEKISRCPAVYSADVQMKVNSKMQSSLKIVNVDYLCEVSQSEIAHEIGKEAAKQKGAQV